MGGPTSDFFDQLGRRGHEPSLEGVHGIIQFDIRDGDRTDRWLVAIKDGDVRVSRDVQPADCVMHTDRATFEQLATGQLHPLPAWLRRLYWMEGNGALVRVFNMVYPGPAQAHDPRDLVTKGKR